MLFRSKILFLSYFINSVKLLLAWENIGHFSFKWWKNGVFFFFLVVEIHSMRYKEIIWVVNLENIWGLSLSVTQEKHRLCSKRDSPFFF